VSLLVLMSLLLCRAQAAVSVRGTTLKGVDPTQEVTLPTEVESSEQASVHSEVRLGLRALSAPAQHRATAGVAAPSVRDRLPTEAFKQQQQLLQEQQQRQQQQWQQQQQQQQQQQWQLQQQQQWGQQQEGRRRRKMSPWKTSSRTWSSIATRD